MKLKLQRTTIAQSSLFLIFATIQTVFGQELAPASTATRNEGTMAGQCALTADQLTAFHGLRLGMNEAEVRKLFAGDSRYRKPENYFSAEGHLRLCLNGCESPADKDCLAVEPARFRGISAIHFTLSGGRVEMITVYFETGAMPSDAAAFSSVVSGPLGLPRTWRANRYLATMDCNGFRVRIEGGDENKLALIEIR